MPISDLVRWLIRNRFSMTAVILFSLFVFASLASRLELRSGFEDLLPPHFESVKVLKDIPKRVGGPGYLLLSLNGKNAAELESFADLLIPELSALETVRYVVNRDDVLPPEKFRVLYADTEDLKRFQSRLEEKLAHESASENPLYFSLEEPDFDIDNEVNQLLKTGDSSKYFIGKPDNNGDQMLVLLVKPAGFPSDIPFADRLIADVDGVVARLKLEGLGTKISVKPLGAYAFNKQEYAVLKNNMASSALLALLGIALLLLFYFRNLKVLLWVVLPPVAGIVWTFGLAYLIIGYLNTQTAFMAAILLGLVVDASIHLVNTYFLARSRSLEFTDVGNRSAIRYAVMHSLVPVSMAVVTTGGAFLMLTFTDFLAFRHFGIIGSLGLVLSMISTYVIFCILAMFVPISVADFRRSPWSKMIRSISPKLPYGVPKATVLIATILFAMSIFYTRDIRFEYDMRNLNTKNAENDRYMEKVAEIFPRGITPTVVLADNLTEIEAIVSELDREIADGRLVSIDRVESVFSVLPSNQKENLQISQKLLSLLNKHRDRLVKEYGADEVSRWQSLLPSKEVTLDDLTDKMLASYIGVDGSKGLFVNIFPKYDTNDGKRLKEHADEIRAIKTKQGTFYSSGDKIIFADMLGLMMKDGRLAVILSFVFIVLCLSFLLKKPLWIALALTPVFGGSLLLLGTMGLLGIKLNFFNFIVFPAIIGIGVDNGIHLVSRYRAEPELGISRILRETGGAVTLTSMTTIVGFATLMISDNQALVSVGLLAVLGVSFCWLTSVVLLPGLLSVITPKTSQEIGVLKTGSRR